jgi:hypothetical protein
VAIGGWQYGIDLSQNTYAAGVPINLPGNQTISSDTNNVYLGVSGANALTINATAAAFPGEIISKTVSASTAVNLSGTASTLLVNGSAGTVGQVLTSAGAGVTPTWTTPSGGGGGGGGDLTSPGPIGSVTPSTGAFTTLSTTGAIYLPGGQTLSSDANNVYIGTSGTNALTVNGTAAVFPGTVSGTLLSGTSGVNLASTAAPLELNGSAGTSGQVLTSTGSGATPVWTTAPGTNLAAPGPIGSTTPSTGAFTTLSATGLIHPTSSVGIAGTTTGDNAQAGSDGEYLSNLTTGTSITAGTATNATSESLTPGDWDVQCTIGFNPASTTVSNEFETSVSTTSNTPGSSTSNTSVLTMPAVTGGLEYLSSPVVRENVTSTTTAYCVGLSYFATSTMTVNGAIRARRVR